ncbi:uncharacterized protein SCHCODRAFT_02670913 [Schizophyllum commune H4-8]|uniref:Uncharacterized protein n=1 Tax=Schizophyllum commune (strain H4-8 / FGSC 9210) TaxID=578458 RepID=D8QEJ0_SCHCM|nr:uncharacterized protein SCHCODRAFT_02670913 [Schizophyllum commune H4-8]KAI5888265.1 hypothetical protein SCHCODRAFT_02670913 [Schizophyllum commune H4-8]
MDPLIEPDDAWKAEVRERVQKDLDSLAQEAFRDREVGLKNAESDIERKLVQEAFDDSIAHLRYIREEQIETEIQKERERMRVEGAHAHGSLQSASGTHHRRGISYSERHGAQNYQSRSSVDHKIWTPSISPEQDYFLEQQRRLGRPRANSTASRSSTPYQPFARSLQPNGRTVSASSTAKASSTGRSAPPPSVGQPRARTASMSSSAVSSSANANPSFTVINEDEYDVFAFDEFDGDYPGRPSSRRPSHVRPDAAEGRSGEGTAPMRIPIVRPEARSASHMARRAATADIVSGSPTAVSLASTAASASQPRSSSYLYVRTNTPHAPRSDDTGHDTADAGGSSGSDPDHADRVTVESEDLSEEEGELKNIRRRLEVARMKESVALGEFQRAMETYHSAKQAREAIEREVQGLEEKRVSKMKKMYREILRMPGKGKARSSSRTRPIDIPEILLAVLHAAGDRPGFWNACTTPLLWEILPDQLPLLKLIPDDAWSIDDGNPRSAYLSSLLLLSAADRPKYRITRTLKAEDWEPVMRLSRHVKVLRFDSQLLSPSVLPVILTSPPNSPILPQIERLQLTIYTAMDNRFLFFLCSPMIRDLQICIRCANVPSLAEISRICPQLTHLRLELIPMYIVDVLVVLLGQSSPLSRLRVLDPARVLRHPDICPAFAMTLVQYLGDSPCEIDTLDMPITQFTSYDQMKILLDAVTEHCSPTTLTHLRIRANGLPANRLMDQLSSPLLAPLDFFRPLSRHRNLQDVSLGEVGGGVSLTESEYGELAHWWPKLVHLQIPNMMGSSCTLQSLSMFAKHLKQLRTLTLKLDARSIDLPADEVAEAKVGPPVLENLDINDGRIEAADEVADILAAIFPLLRQVEYRAAEEEVLHGRWTARDRARAWSRVSKKLRWYQSIKNGPWVEFEDYDGGL